MSATPPPNAALAELADVLGEENVRTLVRTFLRDFAVSFEILMNGDRVNKHRVAHSVKSNSRLMGAFKLADQMAELEARLAENDAAVVTPADLAAIRAEFEEIAGPLRAFVGE